jgi:hypothetical protein
VILALLVFFLHYWPRFGLPEAMARRAGREKAPAA